MTQGQKDAMIYFPNNMNDDGNDMHLAKTWRTSSSKSSPRRPCGAAIEAESLTNSKDGILRVAHLCIPSCMPPFGKISIDD